MSFLFWEGDWITEKFKHLYIVNSLRYQAGMKIALNLLHQYSDDGYGAIIVETGTQRVKDDPGYGGYTTILGAYAREYNAHLWTVDISAKNLEVSKESTFALADHIDYVESDSVKFLQEFKRPIDLLLLDSMDCPEEGDATEAQMHQVKEFMAAERLLMQGSVLVLDDTNFANGGKTRLLKHLIVNNRWEWDLICDQGQTVFLKTRASVWEK